MTQAVPSGGYTADAVAAVLAAFAHPAGVFNPDGTVALANTAFDALLPRHAAHLPDLLIPPSDTTGPTITLDGQIFRARVTLLPGVAALRLLCLEPRPDIAADAGSTTRALANKLNLAIEVAGIGIWEFDETTGTVHWDDRMLDIYGVSDGNNTRAGDFWERQLHPDDRAAMVAYAEACRTGDHDFRHDYRIIHSSGEVRHMRSQARYVGTVETGRKLIGVNIDITDHERRAAELERTRRKLEFDARHDALTQLGNRRLLEEVCRDQLPHHPAETPLTLFLLDLDRFKAVNDTLGHSAGDAVLCRVAKRLRDIFPRQAQIFRLGGDEFAVICNSLAGIPEVEAICQKVITTLSRPFQLREGTCEIGTSIGYLHRTGPPPSITEFFSRADRALSAAKTAGRATFRAAA